jgi:hypothetical protein
MTVFMLNGTPVDGSNASNGVRDLVVKQSADTIHQ